MPDGYKLLTEKERQTLRLIVQGYDAKSMARHLDLSVHTVNERLRHARRKMAVSSSREAARLLRDAESGEANFLGPKQLGEAGAPPDVRQDRSPQNTQETGLRLAWLIAGVTIMTLIIAMLALGSLSANEPQIANVSETAPTARAESEAIRSARLWLALVDQHRWPESWQATGQAFQKLNTTARWIEVSVTGRVPLGAVMSRVATGQESVPAPPHGYEIIKFRTSFANKPDTTEMLSLVREGEQWKVVGYVIG
jgi:DNA-binding CsgD family transcriptional regulator